jgi:nitroimidazol reductase NimA-like FMN-containing flavoprotein (pyridoxamine 5'-phosphate oxidase superfamily)
MRAGPNEEVAMSVYAEPEVVQPSDPSWPSPPDPGDLSKRLVARREELRLSTTQVAARASITKRYLEYLERYPALPGAAVLRRLAGALLTTPGALLGAGAQQPPGHGLPPAAATEFSKLTSAECRTLIARGGVGRVAFSAVSGPVVLPVNFSVIGGSIVLRTSEGSLIEAHSDERAAFEVDHVDEALRQGWSVLIQGQSHRVLQPGELRHVRASVTSAPWAGGERDVYVRIVPDQISGRRISVR